MSDVVSDLQYRVTQIQVFVGDGRVKGWRFVFRHWSTQQQALKSDRAMVDGPSTRQDVDLHHQEFLVDATFVTTSVAIKGTRVSAVTGVEFITSARRVLRVGSGFLCEQSPSTAAIPSETATKEVRAITATLTSQKQAITEATSSFYAIPTRSQLAASKQRIVDAAANKCHHEQACARLEAVAISAYSAIHDALERGVVVPVAMASAFLEEAPKCAVVLTSCGRSAVTWRGKRKPALVEYTGTLDAIRAFVQEQLPRVELRMLEIGDAVGSLTSETVPMMVQNALQSSQAAIAAQLVVKYTKFITAADATLVHDVIRALLLTSEVDMACFPMVRDVVDAYANFSHESVATVMDAYRTTQATLCEFAVGGRDALLLHWLVIKALMDPFDVASDPTDQDTAGDSHAIVVFAPTALDWTGAQRRAQYERLMALVIRSGATDDAQADMTTLLTSLMDREEFQRGLLAIAMATEQEQVRTDQILALVPKITSVVDLGYLAPVAASVLSPIDMKRFFRAYCEWVVAKKLVQVNDDCAFFNTALRQAEKHGYVTTFEVEKLRIEAQHINIEAAPYIRELQHAMRLLHARLGRLELQVQTLRQSLSQLANTLHLKEIVELKRLHVRRAVALVASILYVVGGHVIQASHDVFESWNVTTMLGDGLSTLGSIDPTPMVDHDLVRDAILDSDVQLVLANANVNVDDFVEQLCAAVLMINRACVTDATPSTTHQHVPPVRAGQARRVIMAIASREGQSVDTYHAAVLASRGDLSRFKAFELALGASNADINARVQIVVEKRTTRSNRTIKMRTKTKTVPAHVYASHLGYRAIVDHLLANKALRKRSELAFVTKWRARRVARMHVEAAVGAPAA